MRKQDSRKYLFTTRCLFPANLLPFLQEMTENEQFNYCWATSIIKVLSSKEDNKSFYVNIHYSVFKNKVGNNYIKILQDLKNWGIININDSYKSGNEGFTQSYSWTKESLNSQTFMKNYKTRKPISYTMDENITNNDINVENEIINYTLNNIQKLNNEYLEDLKYQTPEKALENDNEVNLQSKLALGEDWLKKIDCNNYRVSVGQNSGRLYHPIILMPKIMRNFIYYKDSDSVTISDIKSCFPVLLCKFIHSDEQLKYKNLLDGDIYDSIREGYKFTRDQTKIEFQKFINGFINGYIKKFFKTEFPLSFPEMEKNYSIMSVSLQQFESEVMVRGLIPFCIKNGFQDVILLHDGWMNSGDLEQDAVIGEYIKYHMAKICGYIPEIKSIKRTRQVVFNNINNNL